MRTALEHALSLLTERARCGIFAPMGGKRGAFEVGQWGNRWRITVREQQILSQICVGSSNKEIALALGCALKTVECHVTSLLRKVGVESRLQLALQTQKRLRVSSDSSD
jgi:DNA-binding CsgD family transcriptional regulator